jgi:DNA polymerase-3 subunit alpha
MDDMLSFEHFEPMADSSSQQPEPRKVSEPAPKFTAVTPPTAEAPKTVVLPPTLAPIARPLLDEPKDDGLPARLITIFLRPSDDNDRDRRRIKNVYGILISQPGKDRFQFQVFENGRGHLLDFPNDTTRISPDLLGRLKKLMGEETWRVEEITYQ